MRNVLVLVSAILLSVGVVFGFETYKQPPPSVLKVLNAPWPPSAHVSPAGDTMLLADRAVYATLEARARPYLELAGVRVDPRSNSRYGRLHLTGFTIVQLKDHRETRLKLPEDAHLGTPSWSADGRFIAFTNTTAAGVELWVAEIPTGDARKVPSIRVNPLLGNGFQWMPNQRSLLVKAIPADRGEPPKTPVVPPGPNVQASVGKSASSTYESRNTLKTPHDERLFDYYMTSQLALVSVPGQDVKMIGEPAISASVQAAPDGQHILIERIHRPYSYLHAYWRFPKEIEVWNRSGETVYRLASLPLADQVPIHGERIGPRDVHWQPTSPATLVWAEALDGGDPMKKVPHRDRVLTLSAPFKTPPQELIKTEHRFVDVTWGESGRRALVSEWERERRWFRTWAQDFKVPTNPPRLIFDLSVKDRYNHPGYPVNRLLTNGKRAFIEDGDSIYLSGYGASPEGARPFLDRFNLKTRESKRLFRCSRSELERFVAWVDVGSDRFITRRESPTDVPDYFVRCLAEEIEAPPGEAQFTSTAVALTRLSDPVPELRRITKRIVTYTREDGVPLSFKLYLPPDYQEGERLPTVFWAYPLEYSDPETAGQITGTDKDFMRIWGASPLFFLLEGYALINDPGMPVIGPPDTAYDTFIEQLVSSAKAAIDEAVRLGVTDPNRVGIGGHSHGGLMTATLLAHSDLFQAGIARSGAYNHTMRPFGFQSERRTLWEALDVYVKLSPVMHADKIKEPLLLIHGEEDQNPGTVPLQSKKLFECLRGTGGTARLVTLPCEGHGYRARESVEHVIYEMLEWFERYVKNATPKASDAAE